MARRAFEKMTQRVAKAHKFLMSLMGEHMRACVGKLHLAMLARLAREGLDWPGSTGVERMALQPHQPSA